MNASPFSRLPAELRNQIFSLALTYDRVILTPYPSDRDITSSPLPRRLCLSKELPGRLEHPLALRLTCRQIHQETIVVFYSVNTFTLNTYRHDYPDLITAFWRTIGHANSTALRKMILSQVLGSGLTSTIPKDKEVSSRSLSDGSHGDISGIEIRYNISDDLQGVIESGEGDLKEKLEAIIKRCTDLQRLADRACARGEMGEEEYVSKFWSLNGKKQSLRLARVVLSK